MLARNSKVEDSPVNKGGKERKKEVFNLGVASDWGIDPQESHNPQPLESWHQLIEKILYLSRVAQHIKKEEATK